MFCTSMHSCAYIKLICTYFEHIRMSEYIYIYIYIYISLYIHTYIHISYAAMCGLVAAVWVLAHFFFDVTLCFYVCVYIVLRPLHTYTLSEVHTCIVHRTMHTGKYVYIHNNTNTSSHICTYVLHYVPYTHTCVHIHMHTFV